MTIIEALKSENHSVRIEANNNRWLIWDEFELMWRVYERAMYKRNVTVVIETESEEEAVNELLK